ncbi:MAG: hypothetical protein ABI950_02035 [Solirubrobacteraceae bacterium]
MMLMLIDTREPPPAPDRREPLYLDLPELAPWRWFLSAIVLIVAAKLIPGWPGLIPLFIGFGAFLGGIAALYQGNDGLSGYRQ